MGPVAVLGLVFLALQPAKASLDDAEPADGFRLEILRWVNAEREKRSAPRLSPAVSLDRAAQARAEEVAAAATGDLAAMEISGDEISRRAAAAGYESAKIGEIVLTVLGSLEGRLDRLRRSDPETFAQAMREEYRELGVGLAKRQDALIWVLLLGLSAEDDFARRTSPLSDLKRLRAGLIERVNAERRRRRLPPMRENALLDRAAQSHAQDMIRRSYYGHESPEGQTPLDRVRRAGYSAQSVGENIAEGQSAVTEVMDAWMTSPVHRGHILSLELQEIGCGVAFGKNARGYEIVWVQDFGMPGDRAPVPRRSFRRLIGRGSFRLPPARVLCPAAGAVPRATRLAALRAPDADA